MLIYLMADLDRNVSDLRQRFEKNPLEVLEEYRISPEVREVLRSGDEARIEGLLISEVQDALKRWHIKPVDLYPWRLKEHHPPHGHGNPD
ncbi:MAG TPA: hypothetical protein VF179_09445 [Thermoanaerobaculia bacterium]|nr:hypothetical protein [Thermoanaerobaculia bacterium]